MGFYERRDLFGTAVATDGHTILVGSLGGHVHIYDPATGLEAGLLSPPDVYNSFAESISVDGTKAVVGSRGRAFVYDFADLQNITRTELIPEGGVRPESMFGLRVDVSGDTILVGDPAEGRPGEFFGAAYLFDSHTGQQIAKLVADDTEAYDNFGFDLAIFGTRALVGAAGADGRAGAVYLFDASRDAVGDRLITRYAAPTSISHAFGFGYSLDIAGQAIVAAQTVGPAYQGTIGEPLTPIPTSDGSRGWGDFTAITERYSLIGNLDGSSRGRFGTLFDNVTKQTVAQFRTLGFDAAIGAEVAMAGNLIVMGALPNVYVFQIVPEPSTLFLSSVMASLAWLRLSGISSVRRQSRASCRNYPFSFCRFDASR
jgi:hypothetical protein